MAKTHFHFLFFSEIHTKVVKIPKKVPKNADCESEYEFKELIGNEKLCEKIETLEYAVTKAIRYCCEGFKEIENKCVKVWIYERRQWRVFTILKLFLWASFKDDVTVIFKGKFKFSVDNCYCQFNNNTLQTYIILLSIEYDWKSITMLVFQTRKCQLLKVPPLL